MTAMNTDSNNNSRPSTPTLAAAECDNDTTTAAALSRFTLDDQEPFIPSTPPHSRIPLCFPEAPMAPRPRKRVYQPSHFVESDLDDLMIPQGAHDDDALPDLVVDENAAAASPRRLSSFVLTARPAPARFMRRKLQHAHVILDHPNDDDQDEEEAVVRLTYRPCPVEDQDHDDDPVRRLFAKENSSLVGNAASSTGNAPTTPMSPQRQTKISCDTIASPRLTLKRRNSYNALCA